MFFNYIKSAFIRKNIVLYVFSFALLLGQNTSNYSLSFDGNGDYVELPDLGNETDILTVQLWINWTGENGAAFIMGQRGWTGQDLHFDYSNGMIHFNINGGIVDGGNHSDPGIDLNDGWHNIAVVYENSIITFYYDGQFWGTQQNNGISININGFMLGNHYNESRWLSGLLDEYAIWNIALTQEQIQDNMGNELSGQEDGLIAYWNFNQDLGSTLYDVTGNSNDGTIYGATWSSEGAPVEPFIQNEDSENHSIHFDFMSGYAVSNVSSELIFGDNYSFTVEAWYKNDGVNSGNNQGYDDGANIVSSYKRSGGGDPYNNFSLAMIPEGHGNPGTISMSGGAVSTDRYDDGEWHHIVGIFDKISDNEARSVLYIDGEFISENFTNETDRISSYNNIYINNHSPFAGDHMLDCSVAGIRISSGVRYTENFNPSFPFITDSETIFNLDFSSGQGSSLNDLSSNGYDFAIQGGATWSDDVPSPIEPVYGCTDSYADNYNSDATFDDGSCSGYPENGEYSLSFDGVDDYVNLGDSDVFSFDNTMTLSSWVKTNEQDREQTILCKFDNNAESYLIAINPDNFYYFLLTINGQRYFTYSTSNASNQWTNVSASYDGSQMKIFVNGVEEGSLNVSGSIDQNSTPVNIGRSRPSQDNYSSYRFSGEIDNVSMWSLSLSSQEIQEKIFLNDIGPEEGLVGFWNHNEGGGQLTFDRSGNGNHGTINGASWFIPPTPDENNSLSFDGVNDRVVVPHNLAYDFNDQFTIQGWFNHKSDMNERYIITKGRDIPPASSHRFWGLRSNNDGSLFFEIIMQNSGYNGFQIDPSFALNTWNHFSLVYDGSSLKFYLNGVESWSNPLSGNLQNGTYDLSIGYFPHTNLNQYGYFFEGGIDDISLWNVALSSDQIQPFLDIELSGQEQGLVGYWNFNEGEGTVVNDLSGNGNIGTIIDGTWTGDSAPIQMPINGCTDNFAENFNPEANSDDGSCSGYPNQENYALSFDGQNHYVSIPGELVNGLTNSMTINAWVYPNDITSNRYYEIIRQEQNSGRILLSFQDFGSILSFGIDGSPYYELDVNIVPEDYENQWVFISATVEGNTLRLFRNGDQLGEVQINDSPIFSSEYPFAIGATTNLNGVIDEHFDGFIDELSIWPVAMDGNGLKDVMYEDTFFYDALAHFKFNAGEGNILFDHSGNQNHGEINGATWDDGLVIPPTSVTFKVNMRNYEGMEFSNGDVYNGDLSEGIYLAGGNIGGLANPDDIQTGFQMTDDDGDMVYEVTIDLERDTFYYYKFRIGLTDGNWQGFWEGIPGDCGYGEYFDRSFTTSNLDNQIVGPFCFNSCDNCDSQNMSLSFDGLDDYVNIPYTTELNSFSDQISVTTYFKVTGKVGEHRNIVTNGNVSGFAFTVSAENKLRPHIMVDAGWWYFDGQTTIELDTWYHGAFVYDGAIFKLYLDGELNGSQDGGSGNIINYNDDLLIGKFPFNDIQNFPGFIDHVTIWDRALTADEIKESMLPSLTLLEEGLLGFWNFNDGEGNELIDYSGNGNHGDIFGASWSEDFPMPPHSGPEWYVSIDNGSDDNNGSEQYPYATIQKAINNANEQDVIHVEAGHYIENLVFNGKNISLFGEDPHNTFVSGADYSQPIIKLWNFNYDQSTKINGFTFENAAHGISVLNGGGPVFENCIVRNITDGDNGGIYIAGDGIGSSVVLDRFLIYGNHSNSGEGGGIRVASNNGSSSAVIRNSTIIQNSPEGIRVHGNATVVDVSNSIIYGNDLSITNLGTINISFSNVEGGIDGNNNFDSNPQFCNTSIGNYQLAFLSPSVSAGENGETIGFYNEPGCQSAYLNYALSFDGVDDYVEINDSDELDGMSNLTLQSWVKFNSYNDYNGQGKAYNLISKQQQGANANAGISYAMYTHHDANMLTFLVRTDQNQQKGANLLDYESYINLGQWHHIAGVYDGSYVYLYIDGNLVAQSDEINGNINQTSYPLRIASNLGIDRIVFFDGAFDNTSILTSALTSDEIQSNMHQAFPENQNSIVGYWDYNNGSGQDLVDNSDNNNNGFIYGATWVTGAPLNPPAPEPSIINVPEQFSSIQDAVDYALNGDTILVQPGTYYENVYINKRIALYSLAAGGDTSFIEQTIIDANGSGKPIFIDHESWGGEINGFTIQNGFDPLDSENWPNNDGGGIIILASDYTSKNLIVKNNQARWGGGISVHAPGSYLENIVSENNQSEDGGGIFYINAGHGFAKDIVVRNNISEWLGAGIYFYNGSNINVANLISQNNSCAYGPGVTAYNFCHVNITNALITNNFATNSGGGVSSWDFSTITISHSTITENSAENDNAGLTNGWDAPIYMVNSILWGQTINQVDNDNSITISHSIVDGGFEGESILDSDPLFTLPTYHLEDQSLAIGFGKDLNEGMSNSVRLKLLDKEDNGLGQDVIVRIGEYSTYNIIAEFGGEDWQSEINYGFFNLDNGKYILWFDNLSDNDFQNTTWELITDQNKIVRRGGVMHSTSFVIGPDAAIDYDVKKNSRPAPVGSNPDIGAYENQLGSPVLSPDIVLSGYVKSSEDDTPLAGASVIIIEENNIYNVTATSDENGFFTADIISKLNYYISATLFNYQENIIYLSANDTDISQDIFLDADDSIADALVEGTVTDWYTNAPLASASVLLAYTDEEMITIESTADENGYFMVQVPGEEDYDLFVYSDGYWVEHDAFYLSSGEHQVLNVGIAEMSAASRLYGTVRDFDTDELIPYAEIQLNCEQASDWDHTGELGTYRVFNYYPGDCDDGILVVTANGYETSVQSVGNIEFEAGSSYDLDIALVQGNDPDPGMLSGTVYSNIDGNVVEASLDAYSFNTGQLYSAQTESGVFSISLPESQYAIAVNADGHQERLIEVYIHSGETLDTLVYLDEQYSNTFYGIVSNGEESIEGAIVSAHLLTDSGDLEISTISGSDGAYQLTVPDGNFNLSVSITGYQISWVNDVSIENEDLEVNFTLNNIESFDGALMGSVYFFGNLSGSATINIFNDNYFAETVTAENGTFYVNLLNGTYTIFASSNGYASITIPDAFTIQDDVVTYDIHFSQPGFVEPPVVSSLVDVPNDQGRKLDMAWLPGDAEDLGTFTQYSIWRKISNLPSGSPELWHYITTENFIDGVELYEKVVPTLIDANQDTVYYSTFMVTAHTDDPYVFFDSPPYSGFSVDNLSPEAPRDVSVSNSIIDNQMYQVDLSWSTSTAEDFAYYNVYRSDLNSEESAIVFQTIESAYVDVVSEWGNFEYWVTALDHNGNESDASEISGVELSIEQEIIPEEYALYQNYPNPFNPSTQIGYALPENSNVTIVIYNMLGSKVSTLVNEVQDAGFRNILWNATNDNGAPVSAGMYIYTIQAGKFYQAKKMILLK